MKTDITIIIPTYNAEHTIEKCVESLLKQVGNFSYQIIILDDGSSDGTLARLEKYQDNQLVEVVAKQNTGASSTRNVGIEMAEMDSEYLIFVDADDFVEADYLKLLFDQFKDNSNCDLAICGYRKEDENGELRFRAAGQKQMMDRRQALEQIFVSTGYEGYPWNKLFKTSIIKDNQIRFNTDLVLAEDLYFCCEYLLHCSKVSYDPKPVYHYVVQENSQINSNRYGAPYNPKSLNIITTYTRLQSLIPAKYQKVHQSINTQLCWSSTTILRNIMLAPNRDEVPADTIAKLKGIVKQNRHDFMQNTILPKRDKIIFMLNLYAPGLLAWIWKKFSLRGNGF